MASNDMRFVNAAACGDLDDIKNMLSDRETAEAVINGRDKDGRSALHYSCLNDDINLLPLLLADERVDLAQTTPKGNCIFHLAALYSSLAALGILTQNERVMKHEKNLINLPNNFAETPMHLCAGAGDKNSGKTAKILLQNGAKLNVIDKWKRGPIDCAWFNGYNWLADELKEHLKTLPQAMQDEVNAISTAAHKEGKTALPLPDNVKSGIAGIVSGVKKLNLGGLKQGLKKTTTVEKHMFKAGQGKIIDSAEAAKMTQMKSSGKILSKLIDFPGDREEIVRLVKDPDVNVAGKDAFGLTALHKFASWNKPELIELILPQLSPEQLNDTDLEGKTALHWACEMASVATVTFLVKQGVDKEAKDKKGRTAMDILNSDKGDVIDRLKKALTG